MPNSVAAAVLQLRLPSTGRHALLLLPQLLRLRHLLHALLQQLRSCW
jgi:hypothetical protein